MDEICPPNKVSKKREGSKDSLLYFSISLSSLEASGWIINSHFAPSSRKEAKRKAEQLLAEGKVSEARQQMQRAVNITHDMALEFIKECRKRNIDCIVAPYEADGQLAFLSINDIAQYIITEDSDLVLFGCKRIIFKFSYGGGVMVEADKLHLVMGCRPEKFSFEKFRRMCILSGCDYLKSLNGVGLAKAKKFFTITEETDMRRALSKLPNYLNMRQLVVTDEYKEGFLRAEATFKHMVVYNPLKRCLQRLTEVDESVEESLLVHAGEFFDNELALQLAIGNVNPRNLQKVDDWHPDRSAIRVDTRLKTSKHLSIWKGLIQKSAQLRQKTIDLRPKPAVKNNDLSALQRISSQYCQKLENEEIAQLE